jgi:hypothetical protein
MNNILIVLRVIERDLFSPVPRHYRVDITARDTTAPTLPRGDTTTRYIYSARHYRAL